MRRIDAIAIMVAFFGFGGFAFWAFRTFGLDETNAGVWSQVVLVGVLIAWISTYLFRAVTQTMTYNQQLDEYKKAVLTKKLEEMSPEDREILLAEVEAEKNLSPDTSLPAVKDA
jgi:cell division protein FtsN